MRVWKLSWNCPNNQLILDRGSLSQEIQNNQDLIRLLPIVSLAEWATQGDVENERYTLKPHPSTGAYKWSRDLFPDGLLEVLREKLQQQERFTVRVPVQVRHRKTGAQESYFDIYITS